MLERSSKNASNEDQFVPTGLKDRVQLADTSPRKGMPHMSDTDTTYSMTPRTARPTAFGDLRFAGTIAAGLVAGTLGLGALAAPLVGWKDWPAGLTQTVANTDVRLAKPAASNTGNELPPRKGPRGPQSATALTSVGIGIGSGGWRWRGDHQWRRLRRDRPRRLGSAPTAARGAKSTGPDVQPTRPTTGERRPRQFTPAPSFRRHEGRHRRRRHPGRRTRPRSALNAERRDADSAQANASGISNVGPSSSIRSRRRWPTPTATASSTATTTPTATA